MNSFLKLSRNVLHIQLRSDEPNNTGDDSFLLLYTTFEVSVQIFVDVQFSNGGLHTQAWSQ